MAEDLFKSYCDWIDWSEFDGLSLEEQDDLEDKNQKEYGVPYKLKPDAPPEAREAWRKDGIITREANRIGLVIN